MELTEKERLQRAVALQKLEKELDRIMPRCNGWGSRLFQYECMVCGSYVKDRIKHLRWHRGSDMVDILTRLFGRPN